jgi:peptidoglycan hydrolase-like protein with peptidoglycan-binding domain
MTRQLALLAGVLFAGVSASTLAAQSTSTAKPTPTSPTMQHAPAALPKAGQDTTPARASTTKVQHVKWTKAQIKEAQEGLAKAGFYKGKITGTYDRATRKALLAYQKANKLPATGRLDSTLVVKLHSS